MGAKFGVRTLSQPCMRNKQGSLWLLRSTTLELDSLDSLA